jgi:serine/alanine adding enzyme
MIDIISNPDKTKWGNFVYNHPRGNIFQTPEMAEIYKNTKKYLPLTLAAIDSRSDEILALLNTAIIHEFSGPLRPLTSRSIIIGGPLYHDSTKGRESVKRLMEHYDAIAGNLVLYTEIRNLWDTNNSLFLQDYSYEQHLNFLVDLSAGKDKLWKNLSKARRYGITKSSKMGVTIHEISSENELCTLYFLLKDTYDRARHPLADKSLFDAVYTHLVPKNMGKIFFANLENNVIGAIALLLYKKNIYHWYSCSLNDYSKFYPNDILVWHALEWGSMNDFSVFDFMGAGKPDQNYGVREFKRQFGGALVNYGRYKKVHSPIKYWIAQKGLAVYKRGKLFSRLGM